VTADLSFDLNSLALVHLLELFKNAKTVSIQSLLQLRALRQTNQLPNRTSHINNVKMSLVLVASRLPPQLGRHPRS